MDPLEFSAAMEELITRGVITPEQGAALYRAYVNGELSDQDLPLPIAQAGPVALPDDEESRRLLFLIILAYGLQDQIANGRLTRRARLQLRDALRLQFERGIVGRARISVRAWHAGHMERITAYALRQAMAGAGRPILATEAGPLIANLARQYRYAYYFAWDIAARRLLGNDRSDLYVAHRARMYQGAGWETWHRYEETGTGSEFGLIYRYEARDDRRTCNPCRRYDGQYFLPGEGIYPAQVCDGAGLCRCERVPVYDPEIYQTLITGADLVSV